MSILPEFAAFFAWACFLALVGPLFLLLAWAFSRLLSDWRLR